MTGKRKPEMDGEGKSKASGAKRPKLAEALRRNLLRRKAGKEAGPRRAGSGPEGDSDGG